MRSFKIFFICVASFFPLLFSAEVRAESVTMEKIIVSAAKIPVPANELGASVRIITREEIERSGKKDVAKILADVTGFGISQSGGRGGVTALFSRGGQSDYNLVMINGVQINQAGGAIDLSSLSTENIERIEIIKGAHSSVYGSDAAASVINIITRKGTKAPSFDLSAALGIRAEDALIQEYSSSAQGGGENYGYFFSYGRIDDGGILKVNNDYTNNNFSANLDFKPAKKLNMNFFSMYRDSEFRYPTGGAGDKFDQFSDPDKGTEEKALVAGFDIGFSPVEWWGNSFKFGYAKLDRNSYDGPEPLEHDGFASEFKTLDKRISVEYGTKLFFELDSISSASSAGFEYEKEDFKTEGLSESRNNYAFYIQEHIGIFEKFFVTAGIRSDNNENFKRAWSPSVFAALNIAETGTRLRAGIGKGIKEPDFFENFDTSFQTVPNPDLKPEETINREIGIDQKLWDERAKLGITFFQNSFKNLIAYSFSKFPNETNYENINKARAKGVEIDLLLRPAKRLSLTAGYTYLDTEVTDDGNLSSEAFSKGKKLIRNPSHLFFGEANYLKNGFNLNLSGNYVGKRDDMNWNEFARTRNDSFFIVDIAASYEIPVEVPHARKIRLFVRAENLLDKDYEQTFGFSSPGFSLVSGIAAKI